MRIAVPYFNGYIFQHFGRSAQFGIYNVDEKTKKILDVSVEETGGRTHGQLAAWLKAQQVNLVICGGIGQGMQQFLSDAGIRYCGGVTGECDKAVQDYLEGKLVYLENPSCAQDHGNNGGSGHGNGGNEEPFHMPILF